MARSRSPQVQALRRLRAARRRRYVAELDRMEVLYRVYLAVIFGGWGLALLAGIINDTALTPHDVQQVREHGPAVLGLALALAVVAALRSGARGGLLAIEPADVQYPLLAPIDRRLVLRGPVARQIRSAGFFGLVVGLVVANFAFRRLPGSPVEWLACLGAFGAVAPSLTLATGMLAAGRRLRPGAALGIGALLIGWGLADLLLGATSSPATLLALLATLPLQGEGEFVLVALGLAAAAGVGAACLVSLGGLSLDLARRRSLLAAELRFAATVQDMRTVVLLRRQLAAEAPRRKPWLRLPGASAGRAPVWRRDWQSFLRWPPSRVVRVMVLGIGAGLAAVGVWRGTTPLLALPGLLLMIVAIDAVEPLAQEVDHPTRSAMLPVDAAAMARRHLPASAVVVLLAALVALAVAVAGGWSDAGLAVGLLAAAPSALLLVCMAAWSATYDPYKYLLTPELQWAMTFGPFVAALIAGGLPVLLAREAAPHGSSAGAGVGIAILYLVIAGGLVAWIGRQVRSRLEAS